MIIGREHLCGVVVGHDIDDVVALLRGGTEGEQSGYDGKKFFLHDQREELKVLRFEGGALTCISFGRERAYSHPRRGARGFDDGLRQ